MTHQRFEPQADRFTKDGECASCEATFPARTPGDYGAALTVAINELCSHYNQLRAVWDNQAQRSSLCQVALPHLLKMLSVLGGAPKDNGRDPLHHVNASVLSTLAIVHDFSTLWPLNDWRLHIPQRLDWLMLELTESICQVGNPHERRHDDDLHQKLANYRTFFSEGKTGVPAAWRADNQELRRQLHSQEVLAPIRLLGAEIFLLQHALRAARTPLLGTPAPLNVSGFANHLQLIHYEMRQVATGTTGPFDLERISNIISEMCQITTQCLKGSLDDDRFLNQLWSHYQEISNLSVFREHPGASALKLALLEFNTDFSGVPHAITPLIEELEKRLLIDHSKLIPQYGFGYAIPAAELAHTLSCRGARLFGMLRNTEMVGFYIFVPDPPPELTHHPQLFEELQNAGIIPQGSRPGWFEIVGVVPEGRGDEFARAGIRSYALLDSAMLQTALQENCDVLVALVREGPTANLSKQAHRALGWIETSFIVYGGADGTTPYRVLIRNPENIHNPLSQGQRIIHLGERPHTLPYVAAPELIPNIRATVSLSDEDAEARVVQFVQDLHKDWAVRPLHGSLNFAIKIDTPYGCYNLHQLRPRADYWRIHPYDHSGTLDTVLEWVYRDIFGWHQCDD